jgi:hypothetical protein
MIGAAPGGPGRSGLLPAGQLLTPQIWVRRHRGDRLAGGVRAGRRAPALGRRARSAAAGLALGYVGLHHTLLGALAPTAVFHHPAAQQAP